MGTEILDKDIYGVKKEQQDSMAIFAGIIVYLRLSLPNLKQTLLPTVLQVLSR